MNILATDRCGNLRRSARRCISARIRVLVIGVRKAVDTQPERVKVDSYPTLAQIGGHIMGSIFLDSLEVDLERLQRINNTFRMIPEEKLKNNGCGI